MDRRLYLSDADKKIGGVCGGIGEYFNIDPTIIRLLAVIFTFMSVGTGLIAYFVAWAIIPSRPNRF
ncbi:MAG: PspC domain-containing protein [Clostridia bacterium]|nr:PspC domain-containing protein [Clostridia bacterium]